VALIEYDGSGGRPVPWFGVLGQAGSALQTSSAVAANVSSGSHSTPVQRVARALAPMAQLRAQGRRSRRIFWE
jgi:hypothetical protein